MTRAVLLGTGGWPFIIRYWLETLNLWESAVDKVYIAVDHYANPSFSGYLHSIVDDNKKIVLMENCNGWPNSYKDAFLRSTEDLLLILHDDTFIKTPKMIDRYFKLAEEGYVVTPLHEIYSPKDKVEQMLKTRYPGIFPLTVDGLEGYSFLLYLIFVSRENMNKTTLDFGGWKDGEMGADTGFKFMLDLLDNGVKIYPIPEVSTGYLGFSDDPFRDLEKWDFNKTEWIHLQNIGNNIPFMIDSDRVDQTWGYEGAIMRLGWLREFMLIDDYKYIRDYYVSTISRMGRILALEQENYNKVERYANFFHQLIFGEERK